MKGYGTVLHASCHNRGKLEPGGAREYIDEFPVVPGPGAGQIRGMIRVHSLDGKDNATIWSSPVAVTIRSANVPLEPSTGAAEPW